jgi:hypothetical protein
MEHELYRQTPYSIPLDAWESGRATLVFWTIQVQAGQTYERAVIWKELRGRPDPRSQQRVVA